MIKQRLFIPIILILAAILLSATALAASGATGDLPQRQAAIARALTWLHNHQQDSGDHDGAICVANACSSCDIARIVALAGEDPDGPAWTPGNASLLGRCKLDLPAYLARDDAGRISKVLRTAIAVGAPPRSFAGYDLIAKLEAQYNPETGLYHPFNLAGDSLAIIALTAAGRPIPEKAIATMLNEQNADACWGWPLDGDVSDADTTGLVIEALSSAGRADHPAVTQCIGVLISHQLPDAGWEAKWGDGVSNSDSTALITEGLAAAGWDPEGPAFTRNGQTAVQALLSFQAADGSFWWRHDKQGALLLSITDAIQPLTMTYPNDVAKPFRLYLPSMAR